jgi:hypothetical protein
MILHFIVDAFNVCLECTVCASAIITDGPVIRLHIAFQIADLVMDCFNVKL